MDWFLSELQALGGTVLAISGNHDSAERIAFGASLMEGSRVFVSPVYSGRLRRVTLTDCLLYTSMPEQTAEYTRKLKQAVKIPVAFHGHNNLGLSAANALAAYQNLSLIHI